MAQSFEFANLEIESQTINPPKPIVFHVRLRNETVALLEVEDVRAALAKWDEMNAARGNI